jgi:hypothetical protein
MHPQSNYKSTFKLPETKNQATKRINYIHYAVCKITKIPCATRYNVYQNNEVMNLKQYNAVVADQVVSKIRDSTKRTLGGSQVPMAGEVQRVGTLLPSRHAALLSRFRPLGLVGGQRGMGRGMGMNSGSTCRKLKTVRKVRI